MRIRYLTNSDCMNKVFMYIHEHLASGESAPEYQNETYGMRELNKILFFARQRSLFGTFQKKAAYLFCNIAGAHYFSNGNKRLGVAVLLAFLWKNNVNFHILINPRRHSEYHTLFNEIFPVSKWKNRTIMEDVHAEFLYNLAINIADSIQWRGRRLAEIRERVASAFKKLYIRN